MSLYQDPTVNMRLLYLLVTTCIVCSEAVVYRSYINSDVKGVTTSDRFPTDNSTVCERTCESKLCDAYNFNPSKSICQLIQLTSPVKKTFICNRPVPVKIAGCKYELATEADECLDCNRVTIENVGEGVRASCGNQTKLVFVPQESTQPRFTSNYMECNLTAGWSHMRELVGATIKMGCSRIEATIHATESTERSTEHDTTACDASPDRYPSNKSFIVLRMSLVDNKDLVIRTDGKIKLILPELIEEAIKKCGCGAKDLRLAVFTIIGNSKVQIKQIDSPNTPGTIVFGAVDKTQPGSCGATIPIYGKKNQDEFYLYSDQAALADNKPMFYGWP